MTKSANSFLERAIQTLRALFLIPSGEEASLTVCPAPRAELPESLSLSELNRRLEKVQLHQAKLQEDIEKITSVVGVMSESLLVMVVQIGALYHELGLDPGEALNIVRRHGASDASEDDFRSDDKGDPKNGGGLGGMVN